MTTRLPHLTDEELRAWREDLDRRSAEVITAFTAENEPADERRPVFWQHAISECNEAHDALDRYGAPKTKTVPNLRGEGEQEITIGLADRIHALMSKG